MKAYITHLAYALPERVEESPQNRLTKKTGIKSRHIAAEGETASDLARQAAEKIFAQGVERGGIDYLLLCTQSPDYFLPTTACILQDKLQLSKRCGALDFNLGCSGYVYGLGLAKGLIESGQAHNVLLLTAETYSKYINPEDGSVRPVFGDGAAACLIEAADTDKDGISTPVYGTDGSGYDKLIVPAGGQRRPYGTKEDETVDKYGSRRTNYNLYMDGGAIMNFALEHVPETVTELLRRTGLTKQEVDCYVFHQANRFMLDYLQQKCELLGLPYWNDVAEYGNTVSSSIPIALKDMLDSKPGRLANVMIVGFGVGLSWGGAIVDLSYVRDQCNVAATCGENF